MSIFKLPELIETSARALGILQSISENIKWLLMLQKDIGKLFVLITVNQASIELELSEKLSPILKAYCNYDPTNEHPSLDV